MRHIYPPPGEWKQIRSRILARARNACECTGECGLEHDGIHARGSRCGAPNGRIIKRAVRIPEGERLARWRWFEHDGCSLCLGGDRCGAVLIVLTIAHLDHDPTNNADANLRALCQRCHLRLDSEQHVRNAAETRARKRDEASGQSQLFARGRT
jgi:hypothetical protein